MAQKATKIPRLPLTDDYIFKRVFAFEGNGRNRRWNNIRY